MVPDIAARRLLAVQPFAQVAFVAPGALRHFPRAQRAGAGHGLVQAQPVAERHHDAAITCRQIVDGPFQELVERLLIDRHVVLLW